MDTKQEIKKILGPNQVVLLLTAQLDGSADMNVVISETTCKDAKQEQDTRVLALVASGLLVRLGNAGVMAQVAKEALSVTNLLQSLEAAKE